MWDPSTEGLGNGAFLQISSMFVWGWAHSRLLAEPCGFSRPTQKDVIWELDILGLAHRAFAMVSPNICSQVTGVG